MKSIDERIEFLKQCDVAYEEGTPLVEDVVYDAEKEEVLGLAPSNDYFKNVGGLSRGWQKEYTHKYPMGSLFKDKSPEDAEKWLAKTYPNTNGLLLFLQVKLDGSSICVIYDSGKLDKIVTRGNGIIGKDITSVAKYIKDIPSQIDEKGYVEVKGECVKDKDSFYKIWAPQGYNDPRSFVPGTLNSKPDENTAEMMKERDISFVAYEIRGKDFATEIDKIKFLAENKFKTLKDSTVKIDCTGKSYNEIIIAIKKYMCQDVDREKFPFQLDGIVIKNNDISASEELGFVNLRPHGSRAIKFPCEQKEAIIEGIEWQTGKNGVITPVAILKPVFISGATISRSTLHNIKEITRLGIDRLPYKVILIRSGDIIPKIIKAITPESNAKKIIFPDVCPCCSSDLSWDKTETNKVCHNIDCPAQLSGKIDYYLKTLDIKGIGSSTIDALIESGYVKSLSDMYGLAKHKEELSEVFGNKAFANIMAAINSVTEISLSDLITSLSIANIGTMSKMLVNSYPTIEDIDKLVPEDISAIDGFGPTKSQSFVSGWKAQRKEIDKLLKHIKIKEKEVMSKKLNGKSFCVTGTLSRPRNDFVEIIEKNGGRFSSGVSKNLDYLIVGEDCGSKKDKAEKLGVKIIGEKEFNEMTK